MSVQPGRSAGSMRSTLSRFDPLFWMRPCPGLLSVQQVAQRRDRHVEEGPRLHRKSPSGGVHKAYWNAGRLMSSEEANEIA